MATFLDRLPLATSTATLFTPVLVAKMRLKASFLTLKMGLNPH